MESAVIEEDLSSPSPGGFTTPAGKNKVASSSTEVGEKYRIVTSSRKLSASKHRCEKYNALAAAGKKTTSSDGGKSEKTISEQEKKEIALKLKKQRDSIEHCSHILNVLSRNQSGPACWQREEYKPIRESFEVLKSHPHQF